MNRDTFSAWVNTLIRAWENYDAQAAANLFTDNATYQENPFDEPLRGRAAIQSYWSEMPRQQDDIHTDSEVLEVSATSGVARWSASYTRIPTGERVQLEGVFIASFDLDGTQAHTFREWWHQRDTRSDRRVALITGASRGLGATLAGFLAGQGYSLVLTARGGEALQAAVDALKPYHTSVMALAGDVADPAHRQWLSEAAQSFGRLDVLINNASDLGPSPLPTLADYPLPALERVFAVNVIAPVALTQLVLPLLKSSEGLVVNISSDAAVGGYENWGGYGASKAALDLISKTQAGELREAQVGVVSVDPGDMRTVMHQQAFPGEDISDRPEPAVTLPFWAWLLAQDHMDISGQRFQAQAEQWRVPA
jgi:NAD(P)-dependent dehydrogenase (short-subunit alcohol dehydrogenase family)/ketosteroid isomerase-like protein